MLHTDLRDETLLNFGAVGNDGPRHDQPVDHFPQFLLKTLETELALRLKDDSADVGEHIRRLRVSIEAKREMIELTLLSTAG